jgi:pyruvate carboxylase subunit B
LKYYVTVNGNAHEVELVERTGDLCVTLDGKPCEVDFEEVDRLGQIALSLGEESFAVSIEGEDQEFAVSVAGRFFRVAIEDERERAAHAAERASSRGGGVVSSVMPGVVVEVLVRPRETVSKGQPLLILSAMKMQNEIAAPSAGVVADVHVAAGQAVSTGARLVTLSES